MESLKNPENQISGDSNKESTKYNKHEITQQV